MAHRWVVAGLYAGGLIDVDLLNHDMQLRSGKAMGADVAPTNVVDNACLLGGACVVWWWRDHGVHVVDSEGVSCFTMLQVRFLIQPRPVTMRWSRIGE